MRAGAETAGDWLTFTLNVQDFAYPERSAATVERVINLHEQYQLPVDIYLTDNALATFETSYPELLNRLRNSAYVGLNYHIRPPIGADIGWLNGEKRAAEIVRTLSALGVEWDVHVHSPSDRAAAAQRIIALGGTPTTVLSGVQVSDIDSVRVAQSGSAGSYTLTVSDAVNAGTSTDGIDAIETFASRMGARTNVRWASLSEIARAWRSAGSIPSRIVGTQ